MANASNLTPQDALDHIDFLENTLIPDLRESGADATADDFARCIEFMRDPPGYTLAPKEPVALAIADVPDARLSYHGREYTARPCGTLGGEQLYFMDMATTSAVVKRHAARESSKNYNKAKGVVLHAGTSICTDFAALNRIQWADNKAARAAVTWADGQAEYFAEIGLETRDERNVALGGQWAAESKTRLDTRTAWMNR